MTNALHNPTERELLESVAKLCSTGLWKIGGCYVDKLQTRPFDPAHYNPQYFDHSGAICLATGIGSKVEAAQLETAAIRFAKFQLMAGVNVKSKDDVPHDNYSPQRPAALYAARVVAHITTQQQFLLEHMSYYRQRTLGIPTLVQQREALGLPLYAPETVPRKTRTGHDGGDQPKTHVRTNDGTFVRLLLQSGIPHSELERAFAGKSAGRFNKMLNVYWKVPSVASNLRKLFGGKKICDDKYTRVKPIFMRLRTSSGETTEEDEPLAPALLGEYKHLVDVLPDGTAVLEFSTPLSLLLSSGASSSSAPLPLDATEPRGELEIDEFDNLAAVAHAKF